MGRRPKKVDGEGEKEESSNAFQALSELQELGFSQEQIVELVRKAKEGEQEKGKSVGSEGTGEMTNARRSWADVVEAEVSPKQNQPESIAVKKTWVEAVGANRNPQGGIPLRYVEPGDVIRFSKEELREGAKLWDNTLVGMVIGASPSYIEVAKYVRAAWQGMGLGRVHQLCKGVYLFEFKSSEDRAKVIEGHWAIFSRFPLLLKPWRAGVSIEEHFDKNPIWIQLPNLHLDLWSPANLGKVASFVGVPVTTDACTAARTRIDYARVLVEVPFHGKLPKEIPIQDDDKPVHYQSVVYEWMPITCELCGWFGHDVSKCKRKKEAAKKIEEEEKVGNAIIIDGETEEEVAKEVEGGKRMNEEEQSNVEIISKTVEEQLIAESTVSSSSGKGVVQTGTPVVKKKSVVVSKTPILQNLPAAVKNKKGVENAVKNGGKKNQTRPNG